MGLVRSPREDLIVLACAITRLTDGTDCLWSMVF
jgi:hypothetical protein